MALQAALAERQQGGWCVVADSLRHRCACGRHPLREAETWSVLHGDARRWPDGCHQCEGWHQ
eukprot:14761695-Alexandrium_andersonii.AAC.1